MDFRAYKKIRRPSGRSSPHGPGFSRILGIRRMLRPFWSTRAQIQGPVRFHEWYGRSRPCGPPFACIRGITADGAAVLVNAGPSTHGYVRSEPLSSIQTPVNANSHGVPQMGRPFRSMCPPLPLRRVIQRYYSCSCPCGARRRVHAARHATKPVIVWTRPVFGLAPRVRDRKKKNKTQQLSIA